MKRITVFLFILLLFAAVQLQAQNFDGGVHLGLNAAQIDGDSYHGYDKPGVKAGVWVKRNFDKKVAFKTGMNFSQKGSLKLLDNGSLTRITLDYIEIPLLVTYRFAFTLGENARREHRMALDMGFVPSYLARFGYVEDSFKYPTDKLQDILPVKYSDVEGLFSIHYFHSPKLSSNFSIAYSVFSIIEKRGYYNNLITLGVDYKIEKSKKD